MNSLVYEVKNDNGQINKLATYSVDAKKAMIAFIRQQENDYNTNSYPSIIEGMRKTPIKNGWLYDDLINNRILVSYEE